MGIRRFGTREKGTRERERQVLEESEKHVIDGEIRGVAALTQSDISTKKKQQQQKKQTKQHSVKKKLVS